MMDDSTSITIDLPAPPSVNQTRRIDWAGQAKRKQWITRADWIVMRQRVGRKIAGRFEVQIIFAEKTRIDPDNGLKVVLDYLRRIEAIPGDSFKFVKRIIVEQGEAPEGVRVVLKPCGGDAQAKCG